jgi:hypothetical protein
MRTNDYNPYRYVHRIANQHHAAKECVWLIDFHDRGVSTGLERLCVFVSGLA